MKKVNKVYKIILIFGIVFVIAMFILIQREQARINSYYDTTFKNWMVESKAINMMYEAKNPDYEYIDKLRKQNIDRLEKTENDQKYHKAIARKDIEENILIISTLIVMAVFSFS